MKTKTKNEMKTADFNTFKVQLEALNVWLDLNLIVQDFKNPRIEEIIDSHMGMMNDLSETFPSFHTELSLHQTNSLNNEAEVSNALELLAQISTKMGKIIDNFDNSQFVSTKGKVLLGYDGWKRFLNNFIDGESSDEV